LQTSGYNDGFAYRYLIDGAGRHRINEELSTFSVSRNLPAWFFEREGDWKLKSYAGIWMSTLSDSLHSISPNGPVQGPVLIYELPQKRFMAVTEAALYNYSGMRLEASEDASLKVNFTEKEGFDVEGPIVTPWRVIILTNDLNALVNTDIVTNLNPSPDPALFPDTSWIKPGRSVWSWWSEQEGYMTPAYGKEFIDMAGQLGFEYTTIDEGWEVLWKDKWSQLRELCDYAQKRNVSVLVWKHSAEIADPANDYEKMNLFLDSVKAAGAAGVKIDFMNSEDKSMIDFDIRTLQLAAQKKLMINFHGCQKPTGEWRTYPNEITREAIRGLELNKMKQHLPGSHSVALIFTRCILNNADYTPIGFSNPGNTTWTHQLATAYAITSPLITMAENPAMLLEDERLKPVLPFIKTLPSVWDETIVLPGSSIGETAVLARRNGEDWYLVILNGGQSRNLEVNLDFLPLGRWKMLAVGDKQGERENIQVTETVLTDLHVPLVLNLEANGGYLAKFSKKDNRHIY
jgi:alpha-glucosidase